MGNYRTNIALFTVAGFLLSTCNTGAGGITSTPSPVPPSKTPSPPTETNTPIPPTSTFTPTNTPTPSITPTPTATPVDPILAESGYDLAAIRISYPREDIMQVEFEYRLKDGVENAYITMLLPPECRDGRWNYVWDYPNVLVKSSAGASSLSYKLPIEGICAFDTFYLNIVPLTFTGEYWSVGDTEYQELVELPYHIERTFPTINTNVLTFRNFRFEQTGPWMGNLLIDYVFSDKIPLEQEEYYFSMRGTGNAGACRFQAEGPIIKDQEGTYVIPVTLPDDLMTSGCTDGYTSYFFDGFIFYVVDATTRDTLIFHTPVLEALFLD